MMTQVLQTLELADMEQTHAFAAQLAPYLHVGDVITLSGDLGTGKTTFARGLIHAFLPGVDVPSPTYTLIQTYDLGHVELWHGDMYRLGHPQDAYELGLIDAFEEAICLIEWPEKIAPLLPSDPLHITLEFSPQSGRHVTVYGSSQWKARLNV